MPESSRSAFGRCRHGGRDAPPFRLLLPTSRHDQILNVDDSRTHRTPRRRAEPGGLSITGWRLGWSADALRGQQGCKVSA